MDIKVLSIQGDRVYFSSKYGDAFGRWKDNYQPEKKSYNVELDFDGVISSSQICRSNMKCSKIDMKNNFLLFTGRVDECEEGYLSIQMGDSFISFEIDESIDIKEINNSFVTISVDIIDLYDEHII